jgi:transcriptional regulator with XRE-family HTH domain
LIEGRKRVGINQSELGKKLGKPQSYVSKIETGERRLDLVEYVQWTKALGLDLTEPILLLASGVHLPNRRVKLLLE